MWLAPPGGGRGVITAPHDGRAIVPAFQFTAVGALRPKLRPLLDALVAGGVDGWQLWTSPSSPSSLLSGGVPDEVGGRQRERALRAAQRFAAADGPDRSGTAPRPLAPPGRGATPRYD